MGERKRILGVDLGIASCGWGVIEAGENDGEIIAAGVRCFDAPLVDKTGEPKSAQRRAARSARRVIRRRRQRMNNVRKLLHANGILPDSTAEALHQALRRVSPKGTHPPMTPWALRAVAHDRLLTSDELAVVLGHIARHRGFRSNSKRDAGANAADETSKMKKAMEATREGLAKYHSFGEMLANDPKFADRKRNRDKDYSHTAKRSDLEDEVNALFSAQRRLGNATATDELANAFSDAAFTQRPLQDSEKLVGKCPFEPDQLRTARRTPSFELFRFLQRLAHLRISVGRVERPLTSEEIVLASKGFGDGKKTITFKSLRETLDLDPNARFAGISKEKESALDVAARTGGAAYGTKTLKDALGDAPWQSLTKTPEKLDRIAEVLSFREDMDSIGKGLDEIGLDAKIVQCLIVAAAKGDFKDFTRAAHISALACRNIIPGLREGLSYADACKRPPLNYDHSARPQISLKEIGSPVTRKAFGEAIKQIRAVAREYGPFDLVNIELARSVGKSAEERAKITKGIEDRNVEKEKRRAKAAEDLGRAVNDDELLRYELGFEQIYKCVYCDVNIDPKGFAANDTRYQVDHILPWSRFGDDSYHNKSLCCTRCNQNKRGRTPFEWFKAEKTEAEWATYFARVEALKDNIKSRKRKFYLIGETSKEIEDTFKTRNLTDTQWATRLLAEEVNTPPPKGGGFRLRLKAGFGPPCGGLRHLEVVVWFRWRLVFDVLHPDFVGDVATACYPVAAGPHVLAPVTFAQNAELAQQLMRTPSFQVLHRARHRQARRDRQQHVHMVAVDRPSVNNNFVRPSRLTQQFSTALPNVPAQHRMPILRHPDHMILAVPNGMAAALVRFHQATLRANPPRSQAA